MAPRGSRTIDVVGAQLRHYVGFVFFFSIFSNALMLTGPIFMLQIYDRVLAARSEETLVALLLLVIGLYATMWVIEVARSRLLTRMGARLRSVLEADVFRWSVVSRQARSSEQDVDAVQSAIGSPVALSLFDVVFTPFFVVAVFLFHPYLGWLAVVGGTVLVLLALMNQLLAKGHAKRALEAAAESHRFATSVRQNSDFVAAQGMIEPVSDRWKAARKTELARSMEVLDLTGALTSLSKSFRLLLQSLMMALGAWLVLAGELTVGAMIAASILLGRALAPLEQLLSRWPQLERARQGWMALRRDLGAQTQSSHPGQLPRPVARLDVSGLTVNIPGVRSPTLVDVSFAISPGEALGVIGRSGSGKTTLARALLGLVTPVRGEIRLGGAPLAHYRGDLGRHIGFLPQDTALVSGTITENIARMAVKPDSKAVVDAAKHARAHDLILSLPEGYDTIVGPGTRALSGGQYQRIALARALYCNPALLVLDEPNSALDVEGTESMNAAIRDMKADGRSVVIMTHRPLAISECDQLLVLERGRVTAKGPRDAVIRSMMKNSEHVEDALRRTGS